MSSIAAKDSMSKPPPLTSIQRARLAVLEPALRNAVTLGRYQEAKRIAAELQALLRPTGHETRLMSTKNWLFQAAMDSDQLEIAMAGFRGIRQKVRSSTRVYLEATALLAICHLRRNQIVEAEPLMAEVLRNDDLIKSERRRRQFRARLIERFEEETVLAALRGEDQTALDPDDVQARAGEALRTKTETEILADVGAAIPGEAIEALLRVHEFARKQLPQREQVLLPPAQQLVERSRLGTTVVAAAKRVVWRSVCDPDSDVYRIWFTKGMAAALDGRVVGTAIIAALGGMRLGTYALIVSVTALLLKMGLEVFCEVWVPPGVMIPREEK